MLRKPCRTMKNQGEAGKKEGSAPLVHPFVFYNKQQWGFYALLGK